MKTTKYMQKKNKPARKYTQLTQENQNREQEAIRNLMEESTEVPTHRKQIISKFLSTVKMNKKYFQSMGSSPKKSHQLPSNQKIQEKILQLEQMNLDSPKRIKTEAEKSYKIDGQLEKVIQQQLKKNRKSFSNPKVINLNQNMSFKDNCKPNLPISSNITRNLKIKEEIRMKKDIEPNKKRKNFINSIKDIFNSNLVLLPSTYLQRSCLVLEKQNRLDSFRKTSMSTMEHFKRRKSSSAYRTKRTNNFI